MQTAHDACEKRNQCMTQHKACFDMDQRERTVELPGNLQLTFLLTD